MATVAFLVSVVVVGIVVALLLAPLESLGWWAGWYGDALQRPSEHSPAPYQAAGTQPTPAKRHYVVFLDGIAKVGGVNYDDVQLLLDRLSDALPDAVVLGDVMPYSVTNIGLTKGRPLSRFWRRAHTFKVQGKRPLVAFTINVRNLFQVLVSADKRYGPVYNQGQAQVILNSLLKNGYRPGSGVPLTLIGYSGGGQISLGAAPYLKRALGAPITLISLGGVMGSDWGLKAVEHLYHLEGSKDKVQTLGAVVFPGRWPILKNSHWNRAKRRGKVTVISLGPIGHDGPGGYLGKDALLADGRSFLTATLEAICGIITPPGQTFTARVKTPAGRESRALHDDPTSKPPRSRRAQTAL